MGRSLSARETSAHGAKSPRKNGGGETAKIIARESKKNAAAAHARAEPLPHERSEAHLTVFLPHSSLNS